VFLARVQVQGSGEQSFSDALGNYLLSGLEVGTRTVLVSAQGYKVNSQTVQLSRVGADRECVPRRVGVEKPARWRRPNDLLGTSCAPVFPIGARFSTHDGEFSTSTCG